MKFMIFVFALTLSQVSQASCFIQFTDAGGMENAVYVDSSLSLIVVSTGLSTTVKSQAGQVQVKEIASEVVRRVEEKRKLCK